MKMQKILFFIVFASFVSKADISDATRADKAVVSYDFQDPFTNDSNDANYLNVQIADKANAIAT